MINPIDMEGQNHGGSSYFHDGKLVQFDGMRLREENEIISLMHNLREHGIEHLNFTFYGTRDYHNKFCGRSGDYEYMISLVKAALEEGIEVSCGIPATHENAPQIDQLSENLHECGVTQQRQNGARVNHISRKKIGSLSFRLHRRI